MITRSGTITRIHRIIGTVGIEIVAKQPTVELTVCIYKPARLWIVEACGKPIQTDLCVIMVSTITDGIEITLMAWKIGYIFSPLVGDRENIPPRIVDVTCNALFNSSLYFTFCFVK